MYDAIIVGARCSGAPVARLLAQNGYRILMVDKARFPSDTVSTHLIWQAGLARGKRWGLLDGIIGLGAPPIREIRLDVGEFDLAGYPPPLDGIDYALAPRRILLDKFLIDAAVTSGAEFREGFYVNEIVSDEGRVTAIRGCTEGGSTVVEKARIVVGDDGTGSSVAHAVRAPKYNTRLRPPAPTMPIGRAAPPLPISQRTLSRTGCRPAADQRWIDMHRGRVERFGFRCNNSSRRRLPEHTGKRSAYGRIRSQR